MIRRIRNSLSKQDVYALFKKAEDFSMRNVDSMMVLMDFKLAFFCGIKRADLLELKLRDVFDESGEVRTSIKTNGREVIIPEALKADLTRYLDHLRKKGYPTGKKAYLFPLKGSVIGKKNTPAVGIRKWHRDVKKIADMDNAHEKIRQAGIREYFDQLPSSSSGEERLKDAATFAGCSEKWLEIILTSRKREPETEQTGQGAREFVELRKRISDLESLHLPEEELRIRATDILTQAKKNLRELLSDSISYQIEKVFSKRGIKFRV